MALSPWIEAVVLNCGGDPRGGSSAAGGGGEGGEIVYEERGASRVRLNFDSIWILFVEGKERERGSRKRRISRVALIS